MKQDGKFTFTGLLFLLLIFYGGFVAVKLISSSLMESQIEKEVIDTLGLIRGSNLTEEKANDTIRGILLKKEIFFDENDRGSISVTIDDKVGKIIYHFKYKIEVNLIFFKHRKIVTVGDEMRNYD